MANVLGTLFGDIADAIREKTGGTDLMVPADFPANIRAIEGSASPDVRYVTFLSHDGSVEYGKKAVAVGDDCADPIARGVFDTPTRESDAQYHYTFAGWATEANGGLDENALKAVEEDRTVYANYVAAVRYYTITYLDTDGSVLKTESLAYGATPNYTPQKDGYGFDSWNPAPAAVTGEASYTAVWTEAITFANGSWADIAAISESGQASDYFAVGDTKTITVDGASITLRIIGFDHDTLADGSGKAGMTIWAETALSDTMAISNWTTLASNMKSVLKPKLPSELQAVIKPVVKACDTYNTSDKMGTETPVDVTFELFPLSVAECNLTVFGGVTDATSLAQRFTPLGTAYAYFTNMYHSYWGGPYNALWRTGYWMRQWLTFNACNGVYTARTLYSTDKNWCSYTTNTTLKQVMLAFCI